LEFSTDRKVSLLEFRLIVNDQVQMRLDAVVVSRR